MSDGRSWGTNAGRALAQRTLTEALAGRPVLLQARRPGVGAGLREAAFVLACDVRDLDAGGVPLEQIAAEAAFGDRMSSGGSLLSLISGAALRHAVMMVDVTESDPRPWLTFAGLLSTARRQFAEPAAGLVVVSRSRLAAPAGCLALDDHAAVDVVDAMASIRDAARWPSTLVAETAMAVAVEVARGDLDLLHELGSAGAEVAFAPTEWLRGRPAPPSPLPLRWRGREEADPVWLVHNDPQALERRVWRGQLSLLLPWIEMVRIDYVRARRSSGLSEDLEFTPLIERLRSTGAARSHVDALRDLRSGRNELAHGRPVGRAQLDAMAAASRRLGL